MAKEEKGLALRPVSEWAITQFDFSDLQSSLAEIAGEDQISVFDFEQIKAPSGGQMFWTRADETMDPQRTIDGVVLAVKNYRAYWSVSFDESGGGGPPDCSSDDCITGHGDPGGNCKDCEYAQWGSDGKKGQACNTRCAVFMMLPDSPLPVVVDLAPTAVKEVRRYRLRVVFPRKMHEIVTSISLRKTSSSEGIDYSLPVFTKNSLIEDPAQVEMFAGIAESFKLMAKQARATDMAKASQAQPEADEPEVPF